MTRKLLLSFLTLFFVSTLSAQFRILPTAGDAVTGTVSAISGTRILLFDGRITIDATDATIQNADGEGTLAQIGVGDRILANVDAATADGVLRARRIQILAPTDATLHGKVEAVDAAAGTLRVLGQTVRVTSSTILRGFRGMPLNSLADVLSGEEVRVELDRNAPGLTARVVMVMAPVGGIHSVTIGTVESIENNVWMIRAEDRTLVRIVVTDQTLISGTPRVGDRVLVNYRTDASGQHFALSIAPAVETPRPPQQQRLLRGVVLELSDTRLRLDTRNGDVTIVLDSLTTFHGGPAVGDNVFVYLREAALTVFIADRVVKVSPGEKR